MDIIWFLIVQIANRALLLMFILKGQTHDSKLPYLPVYNARPCIMRTPILDCTLEKKKKEAENRGSGYERIA